MSFSQAASSAPSSSSGPAPMELGAITNKKGKGKTTATEPRTGKPPRKLTEEQREKLRKEGLCFYCKEKGHLAFDCPKKTGKSLNKSQQWRDQGPLLLLGAIKSPT
jgi:Zinc knuckle